ncbi:unnamed protein product [Closterium sp. NIES-65]|nr:unnamed protein product [Closterium sp. NIES-65]
MSAAADGGDAAAAAVLPPVIRRLDEAVVNRIAAGEVIQRPASAVKELVENSLDARARSVGVVVKDGGLKMMLITDDGHGIRPEDLPILCERHTTSKLRAFEDLESMATLGFRGEALASLTFVSHLTVTTMTAGQTHGFRAQYRDGELEGPPVACAAVQGTQVVVDDLFFNVPARRKAFRSHSEEYARILDVLSRFAIHNYDVCFSCKKYGEARTDLFTPGAPKQEARAGGKKRRRGKDNGKGLGVESSAEGRAEGGGEAGEGERTEGKEEAMEKGEEETEDDEEDEEEAEAERRRRQVEAVRAVYGAAVARDLIPIAARRGGWGEKEGARGEGEGVGEGEGEGGEGGGSDDGGRGDGVQFSMRGLISSANYSAKKTTMVLFINNRLVECSPLRKACEATYAAILPKAARPFLYLALSLPPHHVDVNVHPTKREVPPPTTVSPHAGDGLTVHPPSSAVHPHFPAAAPRGRQRSPHQARGALPFLCSPLLLPLPPTLFLCRPLPFLCRPLPFLCRPLPFLCRPLPFLCRPLPFLCRPLPFLCRPLPFLPPTPLPLPPTPLPLPPTPLPLPPTPLPLPPTPLPLPSTPIFCHQDEVVAAVQHAVQQAILSSNHTRTFYTHSNLLAASTPPLKPPAGAAADPSSPAAAASSPATKPRPPKHASPASSNRPYKPFVPVHLSIGHLPAEAPSPLAPMPQAQPVWLPVLPCCRVTLPASLRPPEHRLVRTDARIPAGRLHAFFSHRPSSSQPSSSQPLPSLSQPLLSQQPLHSQPLLAQSPSSQPSCAPAASPLDSASQRARGVEGGEEEEEGREEFGGQGVGSDGGGEGETCADLVETASREEEEGGHAEKQGARERRDVEEADQVVAPQQGRIGSAAAVAGPCVDGSGAAGAEGVAAPCVQLQAGLVGSSEQAAGDSLAATRCVGQDEGTGVGLFPLSSLHMFIATVCVASLPCGEKQRLESILLSLLLFSPPHPLLVAALSALLADCTYVGMVDDRRMLLQHSTSLYLVDAVSISKELMWQQAIRRFARFTCMTLHPPPLLADLLLLALQEEERAGGRTGAHGCKQEMVEAWVQAVQGRAEMLAEYFALTVSPDGHLLSLPLLLDHHTPDLTRLPSLALALANEVEWDEEKACFASLAAALADFFAFHAPLLPRPSANQQRKDTNGEEREGGGQVRGEEDGDASKEWKVRGSEEAGDEESARGGRGADVAASTAAVTIAGGGEVGVSEEGGSEEGMSEVEVEAMWRQWEWSIQHVLLPALKFFLKPPKRMARDGSFIKIASLENLYKIFERC